LMFLVASLRLGGLKRAVVLLALVLCLASFTLSLLLG